MKKCLVCDGNKIKKIENKIHGYHGAGEFDVFACLDCHSHQIDPSLVDYKIYDTIYSDAEHTTGYDRYHKYSNLVLSNNKPLELLAGFENNYYPIYSILKDAKKDSKVLEIGCGLGYLTYSINKSGISCVGIDVSQIAIDNAVKKYGNYYQCGTTNTLDFDDKFDYIIATELIEHVPSPYEFIKAIEKLLKVNGKIIITTPNRSFYSKDSIRIGDLPPVHVTWISEEGLNIAGQKNRLDSKLFNMGYIKNSDNLILNQFLYLINHYILNRKVSNPHFLQNDIASKNLKTKFIEFIISICHNNVIKYICNFIYSLFSRKTTQMCIIFTKDA